MKKTIAMTIGFPAAIVAAWFMVMDIKKTDLDPVDFEMSARACEIATLKDANSFIDYNDYLLDEKASNKVKFVAREQCKASIKNAVESQELLLAGKLFSDGFDYEEQRAIRVTKQIAKDYAKEFGAMGKNAARIWIENNK